MTAPVQLRDCLVGANPIIWSNDDFDDLAYDVPLATILTEMRAAGYAGSELGHAYPRTPAALAEALARHDLRLASGWHGTHLATQPLETEASTFRAHVNLLKTLGCRVVIVAECTRSIHSDRHAALGFGDRAAPRLSASEWPRLVTGLKYLAAIAATQEMRIAYHHHLGTVIQDEADLERLLAAVPEISLLLDAGHLAFAGIDPVVVAQRHAARIAHVHLKSVRPEIVDRALREGWSFHRAVASGVFTVVGDGSVDYRAIFLALAQADYRGWLIVEAEDDPVRVPALPKAMAARRFVRNQTGV